MTDEHFAPARNFTLPEPAYSDYERSRAVVLPELDWDYTKEEAQRAGPRT